MKMNITITTTKEARRKEAERIRNANPNSIAILKPELLEFWDWEKNDELGLDPYQLTCGSRKYSWWTCPNHEESYKTQIYQKATQGTGCPFCNGKKVSKGFNDLASQYPQLLVEWDYERNTVSPDEIMCHTNKKVHWICKNGHRWCVGVSYRTVRGHNCPTCKKEADINRMVSVASNRKKSHEQFVAEAENANKHVIVVGEYKNAKTRIEVECVYCGERYKTHPGNILKGTKHKDCFAKNRCMDIESFKKRLSEVHDDIELVGGYVKASEKAEFKCKVCGNTWSALGTSVLRGSGCSNPECISRKISQAQTKSHEQFATELAEKRPHIKLLGKYINSDTPVLAECTNCGYRWPANPSSLLTNKSCPKCAHNYSYTQESYCKKVTERHPDIEVLGTYVNSKTPILVKCKKCGNTWSPQAGTLSAPTGMGGCLVCSGNKKKTPEEFNQELIDTKRNLIALEDYKGANVKIKFKCMTCGNIWPAAPHSILSGTGCPDCCTQRNSFFEKVLYFACVKVFGKEAVIARSSKTIGRELDIYIPSLKLAFEPGSWYYHKTRFKSDSKKVELCKKKGIKLIGIYTGFDGEGELPEGYIGIPDNFSTGSWEGTLEFTNSLLQNVGIDTAGIDWQKVRAKALAYSGRRTTESFIEEMSLINPDVEVLGQYVGAQARIEVKCRTCGKVWSPLADSLLHGHGCPKRHKSKKKAA